MLYTPARHKPKFGQAGIIPGHPLTSDFFLAFDEDGGNIVWDLILKKPYSFDGTYTPSWNQIGPEFNANREHIDGPPLNAILPAASDITILFKYKNTSSAPAWYYFFTVGDGYTIFSFYCSTTAVNIMAGGFTSLNKSYNNYQNHNILGFTVDSSGAVTTKLYADGVLIHTDTAGYNIPDSSELFNIGGRPGADDRYAGGIFEWFYVKREVLTGYEIASLSANPWQWVYDKSEMLVRSVWAIGEGNYVDLSLICESEAENIFDITRLRNLNFETLTEAEINTYITRIRNFTFLTTVEAEIITNILRLRNLLFQTLSEAEISAILSKKAGLNLTCESESEASMNLSRIVGLLMTVLSEAEITMLLSLANEMIEYARLTGEISVLNRLTAEMSSLIQLTAEISVLNRLEGVMESRDLRIGDWTKLSWTVRNAKTKEAVTDELAAAENVKFQLKNNAGDICISKELGADLKVNTPEDSMIQLEIFTEEYDDFDGAGDYPVAIEVIDEEGHKERELEHTINGNPFTTLNVIEQDIE